MSAAPGEPRRRRRRAEGPTSLFGAVYALFAVAAGARSLFQIATKFGDAPVAYVLSALAAVVYLVAALCFWRPSATSYRTALACLGVELTGVVAVGVLTLVDSGLFPDQTVWSDFGAGYGFVPLVLPVAGLAWLIRGRTRREWESSPG